MSETGRKSGAAANAGPSKAEVNLRKQIDELEKNNKALKEEKAQAEDKLQEAAEVAKKAVTGDDKKSIELSPEVAAVLQQLTEKVALLEAQKREPQQAIMIDPRLAPKYKPVSPDDWQEESIVFTARSILYVVGSYKNSKGVDVLPPHGPIVFQYAASDIRKEGQEQHILNYCQYTTNLKTEIAYLNSHPHYGITFSSNANEMMAEDMRETQFKVRAASMVSAMSQQAIFEKCKQYKIAYHAKQMETLKIMIIHKMSEEFSAQSKLIESERLKRMAVGAMGSKDN